uniref:Anoctamin n=1 Tax=Haemonchus placei TaxID=6290 RepID=A0A0N4VXW5_HAEPC
LFELRSVAFHYTNDHFSGASQSFFLFATAFPIFILGLGVVGYDIYTNEERDRFHFVQRLVRDIDEVGIFVVVPATAAVLVILTLLRLHQLRIMRIYQNRKSADDYLAVGSRNVVQKHQVCSYALFRKCINSELKRDFSNHESSFSTRL